MIGLSGTFAINGTNFLLPPTESGWVGRNDFGIDGGGHPIYPAMREFEISWGLAHPTDVKQIIDAYNVVSNTGTVSFDLPEWGNANYSFYSYSGCTMREPEMGTYFQGYLQDVKLTIMQIRR